MQDDQAPAVPFAQVHARKALHTPPMPSLNAGYEHAWLARGNKGGAPGVRGEVVKHGALVKAQALVVDQRGGAAAATQRHARLQRPIREALAGGCATAAAADRDRRGARPRAGAQGGALAPAWALGPLASGAAPTLVPIHAGVTAVRVTLRMPGRRREGGAVRAAGRIMRPIYKRGRGRLPRGRV